MAEQSVGQDGVVELSAGRLYALSNPHVVDARVSWFAAGTTGVAPITSYLLIEGDRALLVDTGVTVHRQALLAQLTSLLDASTELEVLHTRIGEYNGLCNTTAVLERFGVRLVHGAVPDCVTWTDFAHDLDWAAHEHAGRVASHSLRRHPVIDLDGRGGRDVSATLAPLRLLPTFWVYDEATKALLTSDTFSHVVRPAGCTDWVVTADDDATTLDDVRRHLLQTRYWWLADAEPEPIRLALAAFFAEREIEIIGPGYGCILRGRDVVARHIGLLDGVLSDPAGVAGPLAPPAVA